MPTHRLKIVSDFAPSVNIHSDLNVLIKDYESLEAFQEELEEILSSGGVMTLVSAPPENRQKVLLSFQSTGRDIVSVDAEVVYVHQDSPLKWLVGVELKGDWKTKLGSLELETTPEKIWGKDSESLFHKIQSMTLNEKVQLAVRCGREERRILMKAAHQQTHIYLLKNPKITTDEIAQMCRSPSINSEMLIDISNNQDWMKHTSVKMSVMKNPKTPLNIVKKHIQSLGDADLYQLARSDHVREAVSRQAKSTLAMRGKRID